MPRIYCKHKYCKHCKHPILDKENGKFIAGYCTAQRFVTFEESDTYKNLVLCYCNAFEERKRKINY